MEPIVALSGISKSFGSHQVLHGVDLELFRGESHIIAGENGAGKSTLIKILAGALGGYSGTIRWADGAAGKVAVIYQELSLVPTMSILDNVLLGQVPSRFGFVSAARSRALCSQILERVGLKRDPDTLVGALSIGIQQRLEIAKALSRDAEVIVMDEPTSALNSREADLLFALIDDLKASGKALVYITHKMDEIERIGGRISVLRDGELVTTMPSTELSRPDLIRHMVGRPVSDQYPAVSPQQTSGGFSALVGGVSTEFKGGEIVGLAGLQGSGATELMSSIFEGRTAVEMEGKRRAWVGPRGAIRNGFAFLTNDRKGSGLVLSQSVRDNVLMASLKSKWRSPKSEALSARKFVEQFSIKCQSVHLETGLLSGGNQQKVVLAKWISTQPAVLLFDEPTRGVDIVAKQEIYQMMLGWRAKGMAILLISTELPELLALSDRILAMHNGSIVGEFSREEATPEKVIAAAMGVPA